MKRFLFSMLLAIVLVFAVAPTVFAADGQPPVGSCPNGFTPHMLDMHDGMEMDHVHVGLTVDLNGDGWICVKEMGTYHIHVDNTIQ